MGSGQILVVDDDATVRGVVADYLRQADFDVVEAADGRDALRLAASHRPDLIILDLMLPGVPGLEVLRRVRAGRGDLPVVLLTARADEDQRILGLEVGADDYVTKPFSPRELVLRVQSVLRRYEGRTEPVDAGAQAVVVDGDLRVDPRARQASLAGVPVALTTREFDLLAHFMRNPQQAFTRLELLRQVWGWAYADESTVTVHVRRLREKIEAEPTRPRRLATVWGVGYRWDPTP